MDWQVSVVAFRKYQTWIDTVLIALTLLVVITPVAIVALTLGSQSPALATGSLMTVNSIGAVLDVRTLLLMLSLPSGALVRHAGDGSPPVLRAGKLRVAGYRSRAWTVFRSLSSARWAASLRSSATSSSRAS